jgi:ATP-binding cassette subfamily B protein RaxB
MPTAPLFGSSRLPLILPTQVTECGLACLTMIVSYLGFRSDLATMRGRFPVSLNGNSMQTLGDFAERLKLSSGPSASLSRNCAS